MHGPELEGPAIRVGENGAAIPAPRAGPRGIERLDEPFGGPYEREFEPAGAGSQLTTSNTTASVVTEYVVPRNRAAQLVEVAASVDSNGEVAFSLNGMVLGFFAGQTDVTAPWDDALLTERQRVRILGRSAAGSSTSLDGLITAKEV